MKARIIKIREHIANRFEGQNMNFELGITPLRKAFEHNPSA
jgi:hypothetical protein